MGWTDGFSNFTSALERALRRYDDAMRNGAKSEVIAQLAAEIATLLTQAAKSSDLADLGSKLESVFVKVYQALVEQPAFTLNVATRLRSSCNLIEEAAEEVMQWTAHPAFEQPVRLPWAQRLTQDMPPRVSVVRFVSAGNLLLRAGERCQRIAATLDAMQPRTGAGVQLEDVLAGRNPNNVVPVSTADQDTPAHLPAIRTASGLMPIERHWHLTEDGKLRDLRDQAYMFGQLLRDEARHQKNRIDKAGPDGFNFDPAVLGNVAFTLGLLVAEAMVTCAELTSIVTE